MQAVLSRMPGGPESLTVETVADPHVGSGEVIIDVEACSVNFPDTLTIADKYQVKLNRPFSPGSEVCGRVSEVGLDVQGFVVGQRVLARTLSGGMAERLCVPADRCLAAPEGFPAEELAALQFTYATAYHALRDRAGLRPGETLLVLGGAGGLGSAAVALGRVFGARVIAACSSDEKRRFAARCGADQTIGYPVALDHEASKTFTASIKDAAGASGIDVILDPVGGAYTEPAMRALSRNGRLLIIGFPAGIARIPMNLPLLNERSIIGVDWRSFNASEPEQSSSNSREVIDLYRCGKIKPIVSDVLPLRSAPAALQQMAKRNTLGKVVIGLAPRSSYRSSGIDVRNDGLISP